MALRKYINTLTTTGGAGVATATGKIGLPYPVRIHAVQIAYTGEPATTDVTLSDPVGGTLLSAPNTATAKTYYPRVAASKSADGTASTLTEVAPICTDVLTIDVAQGDPAGTVTTTVIVEI